MDGYDINKSIIAQQKYCEDNNLPHFAPDNGYCWFCNRNIYTKCEYVGHNTGISTMSAKNHLVTGCPHCNRSFCD